MKRITKVRANAAPIAELFASIDTRAPRDAIYRAYFDDYVFINMLPESLNKHGPDRIIEDVEIMNMGAIAFASMLRANRIADGETFGDFLIESIGIAVSE